MMAIENLRTKAGMSQLELAEKAGVTQGAVSQWETGESMPRSDKLSELAKILNCTIDELFTAS